MPCNATKLPKFSLIPQSWAVLEFCRGVCLSYVTVGHYDSMRPSLPSLTTGTSGRKVCVRVLYFGAGRPLQQWVGHQVCGFQIKRSTPAVNLCSHIKTVTQVFVHSPHHHHLCVCVCVCVCVYACVQCTGSAPDFPHVLHQHTFMHACTHSLPTHPPSPTGSSST